MFFYNLDTLSMKSTSSYLGPYNLPTIIIYNLDTSSKTMMTMLQLQQRIQHLLPTNKHTVGKGACKVHVGTWYFPWYTMSKINSTHNGSAIVSPIPANRHHCWGTGPRLSSTPPPLNALCIHLCWCSRDGHCPPLMSTWRWLVEGWVGGKVRHIVDVIVIDPACCSQCACLIVPSGLHGGSVARTVDFDENGSFLLMHGCSYLCSLVQNLTRLP